MPRDHLISAFSQSLSQRRVRGGCESCRRRHTKCDENRPSCRSCENLHIRCERETLKFRHTTSINSAYPPGNTFEFTSDQCWVAVPHKLSFVNSVLASEPVPGSGFASTARIDTPTLGDITSTDVEPTEWEISAEHEQVDYSSHQNSTHHEDSTHQEDSTQDDSTGPSTSPSVPPLRLPTIEETSLYRHFVTDMSGWFDINDWNRTCTRELIRRSSSCRLLLKSIYALSSRQLANLLRFDADKADQYHDDCMEELIPRLTDSAVLMDDNTFAATVILRTKEEMEAYVVDYESYLLGIKAFTNSELFEHQANPFREAIYWVALRQDIHSALARQRPSGVNVHVSFLHHIADLSTETGWTKSCILNLAKILMFCFNEKPKTPDKFECLSTFTSRLSRTVPPEFQPLYYSTVANKHTTPFPQMWLLSDTAVHSLQYLTFSEILLSCFNPMIPRVGPGSYSSTRRNEKTIVERLRYLCGIGLSKPSFGPGLFLTCLGISLCGDRITAGAERKCLLDILNETQTKHGWQATMIQHGLMESWKGDVESPVSPDSPTTYTATSLGG